MPTDPPGTWVTGADGKPTQLVSTATRPLTCVRCQAPLPPGGRGICPLCVARIRKR